MAAPAFVNAGTGVTIASGSGACTLAGTTAGNIIILQVLRDGTASAVTLSAITNLENLAGTDNALTDLALLQPVGSPTSAAQSLYIGRSLGGTVSVTVATAGDDLYYRLYEFTGANTGTTLAAVTESIANGVGTGTTVSDTGVTTTAADRLALQFVAVNDDLAVGPFTGTTGGIWTEAVAEFASATGTDGCIQLQIGALGATGNFPGTGASFGAGQTANEGRGQPFTAPYTGTLGEVAVSLNILGGTPADGLIVEIQTDSAGSPSGTVVGSSVPVFPTAVTPALALHRVAVAAPIVAATTYWLVVRRAVTNNSNYYGWEYQSTAVASSKYYSAGVWSSPGGPITFAYSLSGSGAAGTINGGTFTMVSGGWGVVGLALIPAAAGTAHTATPADTISLADSATTESGKGVTVPDTLTVADVLTSQAAFARTIPDTLALADAQAFQRDVTLPLADTVTLADLVAAQRGIAQALADTLALADLASTAAGKGVTLADTVALADALTSQAAFLRGLADTLSLADTLAAQSAFQLSIVDTLALADLLASQAAFVRTLADTLTVADAADPVKGVGGVAHSQPVADTVSLADALTAGSNLTRALADTLALADSLTAQRAILRDLADTVSLADAIRFGRTVGLADTLALADTVSFQAVLLRTLADTIALTDSVAAGLQLTRALADTLALADALAFIKGRAVLLEDTLTLTDLLTALLVEAIGEPPKPTGRIDFPGSGRLTQPSNGARVRGVRGRTDTSLVGDLAQTTKGVTLV